MIPQAEDQLDPIAAAGLQTSWQRDPLFTIGVTIFSLTVFTWILVAVLGAANAQGVRQADKNVATIDDQVKSSSLVHTLEQYEALNTLVTHIGKLQNQRFILGPTWEEIKASVPRDIQFTSLNLTDDGTYRIAGIGRSITSIASFAKSLSEKQNLTMVTPLAMDKQPDRDLYNFSLTFKVQRQTAKEIQ